MLPLTFFLTKKMGINGPAIATLISVTIYNTIRIAFLWKKYQLFPFTIQSVYTLLLAAACYGVCYFVYNDMHGIGGMTLRSITFIILYGAGAIALKLSPDIQPVLQTLRKKIGI